MPNSPSNELIVLELLKAVTTSSMFTKVDAAKTVFGINSIIASIIPIIFLFIFITYLYYILSLELYFNYNFPFRLCKE